MKKITFLIVTWNNADCILECLDSIYKHCQDFKIIIVDNASSDQTVSLIQNQCYQDVIIYAKKENMGFAKGNNYGLSKVDTPYLCYLNPDTILLEDIVIPSIEILEKDNTVGLVGCKLLNSDLSLQPSTFPFLNHLQVYIESFRLGKLFPNFIREKYFPNVSKSLKSKYVDWVIGAEMILRTEDAIKVDGFSTEYYMYVEDMDICKKIYTFLQKKVYYLANVTLIHVGGVSESKNKNYSKLEKLIHNKVQFVEKFANYRETKKTIKALIHSYWIRYWFIYCFYFHNRENRQYYLEKMKKGIIFASKEKTFIKRGV